jgi:catechol 2,3-dioxygenase-like lactoylglutathione lyase family enzyme
MIEGLSHITFVVRDLARMQEMLETVLGAREVYASGDETFSLAREKFFLVGGVWIAAMEGEPVAQRTYDHIAFKIPDSAFDACLARIESLGLEIKPARPRVEGEGRSIYLRASNGLVAAHRTTPPSLMNKRG